MQYIKQCWIDGVGFDNYELVLFWGDGLFYVCSLRCYRHSMLATHIAYVINMYHLAIFHVTMESLFCCVNGFILRFLFHWLVGYDLPPASNRIQATRPDFYGYKDYHCEHTSQTSSH